MEVLVTFYGQASYEGTLDLYAKLYNIDGLYTLGYGIVRESF